MKYTHQFFLLSITLAIFTVLAFELIMKILGPEMHPFMEENDILILLVLSYKICPPTTGTSIFQ